MNTRAPQSTLWDGIFAGEEPGTFRHTEVSEQLVEQGGFEPTSIEDGLIQARCR